MVQQVLAIEDTVGALNGDTTLEYPGDVHSIGDLVDAAAPFS